MPRVLLGARVVDLSEGGSVGLEDALEVPTAVKGVGEAAFLLASEREVAPLARVLALRRLLVVHEAGVGAVVAGVRTLDPAVDVVEARVKLCAVCGVRENAGARACRQIISIPAAGYSLVEDLSAWALAHLGVLVGLPAEEIILLTVQIHTKRICFLAGAVHGVVRVAHRPAELQPQVAEVSRTALLRVRLPVDALD